MALRLDGEVAAITGAGAGNGLATLARFVEQGDGAAEAFGGLMNLAPGHKAQPVQQIADRNGTHYSTRRSGRQRDIAEAALFLAPESAGLIAGTQLTVDGGITIGSRHAWDPETPGPMTDALGLSLGQLRALRVAWTA